jgi:predicted transposase/invertase (TIGR01784 family)
MVKGIKSQKANQYDRIWRENMQAALPGIIEKVLNINIVQKQDLPDKVLMTKQREVDVLQKIVDSSGKIFILHIEIQVKNESEMVYRMAEYRIMIERLYKLPVRQYVLYIGLGKSDMPFFLRSEGLYFRYNLVSFSQISYKLFISSQHPEQHLLAILADFEGEEPETIITTILQKIQQASDSDFSENQYVQQLRILIQLRNLSEQFNHAMEKVSKFFKEERDPFFQKGIKKGIEEGIEMGIVKGIEQGIDIKNHEVVKNLILELGLSDEQTSAVAGVSVEFVKEIRTAIDKK